MEHANWLSGTTLLSLHTQLSGMKFRCLLLYIRRGYGRMRFDRQHPRENKSVPTLPGCSPNAASRNPGTPDKTQERRHTPAISPIGDPDFAKLHPGYACCANYTKPSSISSSSLSMVVNPSAPHFLVKMFRTRSMSVGDSKGPFI